MDALKYISNKYDLDLNKASPIEISNMGRDNLTQLFAELGFKVGAEIGTERGYYAKVLCRANPELKLYCIDAWIAYPDFREHVTQSKIDEIYRDAQERLSPFNCKLMKSFSADAVGKFDDKSLDFVYIDSNHKYEYIIQDLTLWSKKVKPGGIVAGHDYIIPRNNPKMKYGIVEAVNEYTESHNITPWFLIGTKAKVPGEVRDSSRSWMWVQS